MPLRRGKRGVSLDLDGVQWEVCLCSQTPIENTIAAGFRQSGPAVSLGGHSEQSARPGRVRLVMTRCLVAALDGVGES